MRSSLIACLALVPWAACTQQPLNDAKHRATPTLESSSYRDQLLSLHKQLVSIPSISGDENAVGNFLVDYLTARGYHAELQPVAARQGTPTSKQRFNVLAWKGERAPSARIVVSSHIDVVPPHIPYSISPGEVTSETMIKGRGSVDAKGSVAAMIVALEQLHASNAIATQDDVMLLFVVGEEVAGDGMATFSHSLSKMKKPPKFDAVIFGEPTENRLACGHKGGLFCSITARGVPGHSGYPWLGKSANDLMVRALAKILDANLGSSELFGNTTFNAGRFDGGVAANVIPEKAVVQFAARVATGPEDKGHEVVAERIQRILHQVDDEAFEMDCTHGYGSVKCNCEVDGFEKITVNYGTDIPNLAGNHTRYLYGPGNILVAHGARENLTVADLEEAVEGYQKLIVHALTQ
ncbi:acetylornithine deacetylase [Metarhizium album ARSEF 1941]|uniref:Acetylornithine deacetylase n=1 Tax=Metarhizium album (strain ARSEF 1941) TaxID=1081103 RepID=A0A0B2WPJ6_METAS|nr:acetylornithine deacetylase [Metarhizium album ARSEF 1941]KHN97966.1 acetylornithine deacetylase [Metarhizium album ARSEF 1941]